MRVIKIIGHPILLVSLFVLCIIEGDHFGGFYLLFVLLALPHGAIYAITGIAGIALVLSTGWLKIARVKQVIGLAGLALMVISLLNFFGKSEKTGVDATFYDTIPIATFILLALSITCFIVDWVITFSKTLRWSGFHS